MANRSAKVGVVTRVEQLTPQMVRVRRVRAEPGRRLAPAGRRRERTAGHRRGAGRDARGCAGAGLHRGGRRRGGTEAGHRRGRRDLWLHRGDRQIGEALVSAVRDVTFPAGRLHAFVHGEATFVKDLRRYLRMDRGVPLDRLSISGYWRRGMNEDGWQSSKREWNQQVDREQEAAAVR